jgi:hypothetical protein
VRSQLEFVAMLYLFDFAFTFGELGLTELVYSKICFQLLLQIFEIYVQLFFYLIVDTPFLLNQFLSILDLFFKTFN